MAAILWQVPRQMFAAVRAAIYIVAKHRHANICKRTASPFLFFFLSQKWSTTHTDGIKRCGSLVPELCFIQTDRKKALLFCRGGRGGGYAQQSQFLVKRILPSLPSCVQKCKRMISLLHLSRRGSL